MKKILFIFLQLFCIQGAVSQQYLLKDFKPCIAVLKNGLPIQENFNYNCVTQAVEFKNGEEVFQLYPISQIDTLYLGNHKMIPYGTRFLEVYYNSPEFTFLVDYKRKIKEDGKVGAMGIKTQHGVQNVDYRSLGVDYRQDWERGVVIYGYNDETSYWLKRERKMKKFKDLKSFVKIFPDKKDDINRYVNSNQVDFKNAKMVLELLMYCMEKK